MKEKIKIKDKFKHISKLKKKKELYIICIQPSSYLNLFLTAKFFSHPIPSSGATYDYLKHEDLNVNCLAIPIQILNIDPEDIFES